MSDATIPSGEGTYKGTLNLPTTEFPMKGNLAQLEPRMLAFWEENRVYEQLIEKNRGRPLFVLHDGPPYANGHLHAGHALNKILKDIVVKYRNMSGLLCEFVPGWDCHGLPIEQAVEKRLREKKLDKRAMSKDEFLAKCREYALEFVDIQRDEFKRLGVLGRWEAPYTTLSFDYEAQEIRELATFARHGSLYRKKKPVYWCVTDATALAEAEVEYEEHESPSVYVAFEAVGDLASKWPVLRGKKVAFAIWTTTPWTLPANLAICVHPKLEYAFYELGDRVVVVAKDLLSRFLAEVEAKELSLKRVALPSGAAQAVALGAPTRILGYAAGTELAGFSYRHVFYERTSPILLAEHVTLEQGTGLVHTAPGHGQEDFEVGIASGLDVYNPVGNDGRYDETVGPELCGKKVLEANALVIQMLVDRQALLNSPTDTVKHSYPHCWRCHNPIIFRATHQWFISLAKGELRQRALAEVDRIKWTPKWGRDRIRGMLEARPDWCISRQRSWGVPIPMALCEGCGEAVVDADLMERVAQRVEKEGAGVWYRTPIGELLAPGTVCRKCGGAEFRRETDILDVWFDSACSFAAVAARQPNLRVPVDLYLEGSDQHRGWFHSTLLVGVGTRGRSPYESCLTHGFVVDGQGRKMAKSLGNVLSLEQMTKQRGAEIVRLWVASSDYRDDITLSDAGLRGVAEGYRKIRNTLRYALSNLFDFDPAKDRVAPERLLPLERWVRRKLSELLSKVARAYEAYEFHLVYHSVVDFCAMELSSLYFDIRKDCLYTAKADSPERRSAQTALYEIADALLRLLAPVMSFTAEEAWQLLPGRPSSSVFHAGFPTASLPTDEALVAEYEQLFLIRAEAQKLLEAARRDKLIGKSLEAKLVLYAQGSTRALAERHRSELAELFIVSQVELADSPSPSSQALALPSPLVARAEVVRAEGTKCPRCWTFSEAVGRASPVCDKCVRALAQP